MYYEYIYTSVCVYFNVVYMCVYMRQGMAQRVCPAQQN